MSGLGLVVDLFRFYCPSIDKSSVQLPASEAKHLSAVLRLSRGDKVELFDGAGTVATATVKTVGTRKVILEMEKLQVVPRPVHQQIIIAASIAKGERFDWLIGKCTELGVERICPVLFERTVKQPKNPKAVERWLNVAIAAAKQSRRLFLPVIDTPLPLVDSLKGLRNDYPKADFLFGCPSAKVTLINISCGSAGVAAFIGPEGGVTEDEEKLFHSYGCRPVRIVDNILRVETAAIAFAAVLAAGRSSEKIDRSSDTGA